MYFKVTEFVVVFIITAFDHWWWLLWPWHECTTGRVWDGSRQACLFWCYWQNDVCHRLRLQEPLTGLRGYKEWKNQEGKEIFLIKHARLIQWKLPFGFPARLWDKAWELGMLDQRMIVVVRQIDFQANQLSWLHLQQGGVCVHQGGGINGESLSCFVEKIMCVVEERGSGDPLWGFYSYSQAYLISLNILHFHRTVNHTCTGTHQVSGVSALLCLHLGCV